MHRQRAQAIVKNFMSEDRVAQVFVLNNKKVLMVKQYVERGDIVWNFPGGGIENEETPEHAAIREAKEETGYDVKLIKLVCINNGKYTYTAEIAGGALRIDKNNPDNSDIIDAAWVDIDDTEKWDSYTIPILDIIRANAFGFKEV